MCLVWGTIEPAKTTVQDTKKKRTSDILSERTLILYLQFPLGSLCIALNNAVLHVRAAQKNFMNEQLPTSGRAASLPERVTKKKPDG